MAEKKVKPLGGMRFTPRKDEVQAVVDVLESGEFDDAPQMAKALLKEVADLLWHRNWYVAGLVGADGKPGPVFGPFSSEGESVKFAEACMGIEGMSVRKAAVNSPARLAGLLHGAPGVKGFCANCGDSPFDHLTDGSSRGKCALPECKCDKWKEIK